METHREEGILVAAMPERLDAVTAPEVEKELVQLGEADEEIIVCDFTNTSYVSSAGLRVMLMMTKKQRGMGRRLVVLGLQQDVKMVFELAGFDSIMEIAASKKDVWQGS